MKRLAALLLGFVLLSAVFSCQKIETYGTLTVDVYCDEQMTFTIDVYPYSNEINWQLPVFTEEYNRMRLTEDIQLAPGNYIVRVGGSSINTQAVNIIAGENKEITVYLSRD